MERGITHSIGTGGRELEAGVGGVMMTERLKAFNEERDTGVIYSWNF